MNWSSHGAAASRYVVKDSGLGVGFVKFTIQGVRLIFKAWASDSSFLCVCKLAPARYLVVRKQKIHTLELLGWMIL